GNNGGSIYNERYKGGLKMLELIDLSKRYKDQYAVKSMNMYIEKGEIIGLLGPNEAVKSTTISMLSTLIELTEGDGIFKKESILTGWWGRTRAAKTPTFPRWPI